MLVIRVSIQCEGGKNFFLFYNSQGGCHFETIIKVSNTPSQNFFPVNIVHVYYVMHVMLLIITCNLNSVF